MGNSAAYPGPGQACSGFLVEDGNSSLLVDCGTGVLANLQRYIDLRNVSDIVISHLHADHFFDLIPYRYALRYGLSSSQQSRPRLHLPPEGCKALDQTVASFSESESFFSDVFEVSEYDPNSVLRLGQLSIHFFDVVHYIPTYAAVIHGDRTIAYSADTGPCPNLTEVARDADLFLCNIGRTLEPDNESLWGHLTPADAGIAAREGGAKRLLLTHFWPATDRRLCLEQASRTFQGSVELAEACHTYDV